jgi:hypothetical protein
MVVSLVMSCLDSKRPREFWWISARSRFEVFVRFSMIS